MQKHIPALDSLRGIAILLVLFLHYGLLEFGWIGVQLFFVLSGYLITQILLDQKGRAFGEYLKSFYVRRCLRIFPLYFGYLFLFTIIYLITGWPHTFHYYWINLYTYTLNWFEPIRVLGIPNGRNDPFYHLWSLSVEEQFYLIWPWLVFFLSALWCKLLAIFLIITVPIFRVFGFEAVMVATGDRHFASSIIYYVTPFQLDAFAWGALVAILPPISAVRAKLLAVSGLLVLAAASVANFFALRSEGNLVSPLALGFPPHMPYNGQYAWGYVVINAASAGVILYLLTHPAKGIFNWTPLQRIGKVSYGMYILHFPILGTYSIWLVDLNAAPLLYLSGLLLYCALVWVSAEISYRLIESPFLKLKARF